MTQRYFSMLFLLVFVALYIAVDFYFPQLQISKYIVVWVMCGIYAGQYSAKYPKE